MEPLPKNGRIPEYTYDALNRYVVDHIEPGTFLRSVLSNDLVMACSTADYFNRRFLWDLVQYIMMYVPPECWGSYENVNRWIEEGKQSEK